MAFIKHPPPHLPYHFHTSTTCSATLWAICSLNSSFILRFVCWNCSTSARFTSLDTRLHTVTELELLGLATWLAWQVYNGCALALCGSIVGRYPDRTG